MNSSSKKTPLDLIPIGKILKPRGLKGELKVFLYNKNSSSLVEGINIWTENEDGFILNNIEYINESGKYFIIKFDKADCREEAEINSNRIIYISREDFLDKNDFYLVDLIGFTVKNELNELYGKVKDVINLPTNDSLLIEYKNKEILIPIIDDFIVLFDYDNNYVIIKNSDTFIN